MSIGRSWSFPLSKRQHDGDYVVLNSVQGIQVESCVLSEKKESQIRLQNARNEFLLAKGVKYNRDADEHRKKIALVMLLRAAKNGSALALEELSDCYRRGVGTRKDERVATELLKAFLQRSVQTTFLEELLSRAYGNDERMGPSSRGKAAKSRWRVWFGRRRKNCNKGEGTSQRLLCFIYQ